MNEFLFPLPERPPEDIYFASCPKCKNNELLVAPYKILCSKCGQDFYLVMPSDMISIGFSLEAIQKTADEWNHFADTRKKDVQ